MVNLTFSFSTRCHVDENQVTCHLKERPGRRPRYYIIHRAGPGGIPSHTQYLRLHVSIFNKYFMSGGGSSKEIIKVIHV